MFSLIITVISIALVAALALATLYYGGDAFKRGAASADATKLYVQSQQLQGAAELYKADTGAYPLTMEAMLTGNYLKSIPVSSLNPSLNPAQETGNSPALMAQASAAGVVWKMVLAGQPVFAMTQVSAAVCEAVNMKAYGISGILKSARAGYSTQCFGPDLANLTMVTTKSGAALITASLSPLATVSLGTVLTTAPPAVNSGDTTSAGWLTLGGVALAAVTPPAQPSAPVGAASCIAHVGAYRTYDTTNYLDNSGYISREFFATGSLSYDGVILVFANTCAQPMVVDYSARTASAPGYSPSFGWGSADGANIDAISDLMGSTPAATGGGVSIKRSQSTEIASGSYFAVPLTIYDNQSLQRMPGDFNSAYADLYRMNITVPVSTDNGQTWETVTKSALFNPVSITHAVPAAQPQSAHMFRVPAGTNSGVVHEVKNTSDNLTLQVTGISSSNSAQIAITPDNLAGSVYCVGQTLLPGQSCKYFELANLPVLSAPIVQGQQSSGISAATSISVITSVGTTAYNRTYYSIFPNYSGQGDNRVDLSAQYDTGGVTNIPGAFFRLTGVTASGPGISSAQNCGEFVSGDELSTCRVILNAPTIANVSTPTTLSFSGQARARVGGIVTGDWGVTAEYENLTLNWGVGYNGQPGLGSVFENK